MLRGVSVWRGIFKLLRAAKYDLPTRWIQRVQAVVTAKIFGIQGE